MKTKKETLLKEIEEGKLFNCYFLSGENEYIIEEVLQLLKEKILNPGFEAFDLEKFDAGEKSFAFDNFRRALSTPPMASSKRMIILQRVDKLIEREKRDLLTLLEIPAESSVLVMISSPEKKKLAFFNKIREVSRSENFKNLPKYSLEKWIKDQAGKKGYSIDNDAVLTIMELAGNNQISLSQEIEKIETYLGDTKNITGDDVLKVLTSNMVSNVFDLTKAIGERDRDRALAILNYLLEWGEVPERVHAILRKFFLLLKGIKYYSKKGFDINKTAQKLSVMSFIVNNEIRFTKNFTLDDLKKRLKLLYDAEVLMKTGGEKDLILTNLVYNLN